MKDKQFYILLGLGAFVVYSIAVKAKAAAGSVVDAVDPTSSENIFYGGINAIGDTFDNSQADDSFSLGGWLYDLTHSDIDLEVTQ